MHRSVERSRIEAAVARRTFLKVGVAGAALLLVGRWLAPTFAGQSGTDAILMRNLAPADARSLRRIVPVLLEGALPADKIERETAIVEIIHGVDRTVGHQSPAVRQEIRDLFGLLSGATTRALVAGIWSSWEQARDDDIRAFLTSWRNSRFDLLRAGYAGLNNLIATSWYGNPRSWTRIGYAGPPSLGRTERQS